MFESLWFPWKLARQYRGRRGPPRFPRPHRCGTRLCLEQLEDRTLPSNFTAATVSDLIADINAANLAGGTNTITLTAPTGSLYVLTAVDNTTNGATGLPVIANKGLTIVGNGDTIERSTASGTPAFRLFEVASGASLTTENLTLQNGLAAGTTPNSWDGTGGAFLNFGALTVNGCTLSSNSANPPNAPFQGMGGGIGNIGGTLMVNACTLSGNLANDLGGGIFNLSGHATIQSSTLSGNSAGTATSGGDGGAINNNAQGTMKIVGCTLSGNVANDDGGAILNYGTLTVVGCTLSSNSAVFFGGGIANVGRGTVTVESSEVSGNVAGHGGGGIYEQAAFLKVKDSDVCGNTAPIGADLYNNGGKLDVENSDICVIAP